MVIGLKIGNLILLGSTTKENATQVSPCSPRSKPFNDLDLKSGLLGEPLLLFSEDGQKLWKEHMYMYIDILE